LRHLERFTFLNAVVCKPTLLGGLSTCMRLANWCRKKRIQLVVSSEYESGLGQYGLSALAAALDQPPVAHGLGTGILFAENPCPIQIQIRNGELDRSIVEALPPVPTMNHIRLIDD
jgi:O-succinylbenzoate synthase